MIRKFRDRVDKEWHTTIFKDVISEAYANTTDGDELRAIVISVVMEHRDARFFSGTKQSMEFCRLLKETELGAELALALAASKSRGKSTSTFCERKRNGIWHMLTHTRRYGGEFGGRNGVWTVRLKSLVARVASVLIF